MTGLLTERSLQQWSKSFARRTRNDVGGGLASILALAGATDIVSFSGGFPDPATFPSAELTDVAAHVLASTTDASFQYAPTEGLPGPRRFIRERLGVLEGIQPSDPEFLITSGGIEALELLGKTFLDPGDAVVVEAPTYLGAIMAFRSFEAEILALSSDDEGLDPDKLARVLANRRFRPKLLYTIPDHQNPSGTTLSVDRRTALVELSRRYGFLIVEDVAYRELSFSGERLPSLWSLAPENVVQAGTFSKTFFPGVRLGWAAGPAEVIAQLVLAKQNTDQCAGALGQRLLEEYGRRGLLDGQNRRARALYARRCALLLHALETHMPAEVSWTRPKGGFFSWLTLPSFVDTVALAEEARALHVAYVPGPPFFPNAAGRNQLRLAYSKVDDGVIDEGIRRLGVLFKAAINGRS